MYTTYVFAVESPRKELEYAADSFERSPAINLILSSHRVGLDERVYGIGGIKSTHQLAEILAAHDHSVGDVAVVRNEVPPWLSEFPTRLRPSVARPLNDAERQEVIGYLEGLYATSNPEYARLLIG
ncbi:MAG: hypothetical protein AABX51_02420 [Nanoarchaeota archaeon]